MKLLKVYKYLWLCFVSFSLTKYTQTISIGSLVASYKTNLRTLIKNESNWKPACGTKTEWGTGGTRLGMNQKILGVLGSKNHRRPAWSPQNPCLFFACLPTAIRIPRWPAGVSANSVEASHSCLVKALFPCIRTPLYQHNLELWGLWATKKISDLLNIIVRGTITPLSPLVSHTTASPHWEKIPSTLFLTGLEHRSWRIMPKFNKSEHGHSWILIPIPQFYKARCLCVAVTRSMDSLASAHFPILPLWSEVFALYQTMRYHGWTRYFISSWMVVLVSFESRLNVLQYPLHDGPPTVKHRIQGVSSCWEIGY